MKDVVPDINTTDTIFLYKTAPILEKPSIEVLRSTAPSKVEKSVSCVILIYHAMLFIQVREISYILHKDCFNV